MSVAQESSCTMSELRIFLAKYAREIGGVFDITIVVNEKYQLVLSPSNTIQTHVTVKGMIPKNVVAIVWRLFPPNSSITTPEEIRDIKAVIETTLAKPAANVTILIKKVSGTSTVVSATEGLPD